MKPFRKKVSPEILIKFQKIEAAIKPYFNYDYNLKKNGSKNQKQLISQQISNGIALSHKLIEHLSPKEQKMFRDFQIENMICEDENETMIQTKMEYDGVYI